jgi:uncharacterized membrane protein YebE (DUF533 family)
MSFGDILGQILQNGLGQGAPTRSRVETSARNLGQGGTGIDSILGSLQKSLGGVGTGSHGTATRNTAGGFADKAKDFMQKDQVGGLSGAQVTGIGAIAGALLGGGVGGAARGSAMAVLGTLALGALKGAQARAQAGQPGTGTKIDAKELHIDPAEIEAVTAPDAEKLLVRAMIAAAKSDGKLDETEVKGILGKITDGGVTEDEKAFVMAEMRAPLDIDSLTSGVRNPAQAAQVYAASLMAINVDTESERAYLRDLGQKLGLNAPTVAKLHELTGAAV